MVYTRVAIQQWARALPMTTALLAKCVRARARAVSVDMWMWTSFVTVTLFGRGLYDTDVLTGGCALRGTKSIVPLLAEGEWKRP